jgi:hypothetical protein
MPLGARSPLHLFTLTGLEHRELTRWIRFGNRQALHELQTALEVANDEFVDDPADPEPIDERSDPGPQSVAMRRRIPDGLR